MERSNLRDAPMLLLHSLQHYVVRVLVFCFVIFVRLEIGVRLNQSNSNRCSIGSIEHRLANRTERFRLNQSNQSKFRFQIENRNVWSRTFDSIVQFAA